MEIFLATVIQFRHSATMPEIYTFWFLSESEDAAREFAEKHVGEKILPQNYQLVRTEVVMQDKEMFRAMFEALDRKLLKVQGKTKAALN